MPISHRSSSRCSSPSSRWQSSRHPEPESRRSHPVRTHAGASGACTDARRHPIVTTLIDVSAAGFLDLGWVPCLPIRVMTGMLSGATEPMTVYVPFI